MTVESGSNTVPKALSGLFYDGLMDADGLHIARGMYSVPRFVGYEGTIADNDGDHIIECVCRVDGILLPDEAKRLVKAILWVHDIPEGNTGDVLATAKDANAEVRLKTQRDEDSAARALLPPDEYGLWKQLELAGEVLKRRITGFVVVDGGVEVKVLSAGGENPQKVFVSWEAFIAKLIDCVEGNSMFHSQVSWWVLGKSRCKYDPARMPADGAMVYTFNQFASFITALEQTQMPKDYYEAARQLLVEELGLVVSLWADVLSTKPDRVPVALKEKLAQATSIVNHL